MDHDDLFYYIFDNEENIAGMEFCGFTFHGGCYSILEFVMEYLFADPNALEFTGLTYLVESNQTLRGIKQNIAQKMLNLL